MPNLPISRLINVQVNLAPLAAQAQDLSTLLVLGSSNVIDVTERLRTYTSLDEVAADFGTTAPEYLCAVLWFEQAPQPTQIKIGRWAETATQAKLVGGPLSAAEQVIALWTAIVTPGFEIEIDGIPFAIAPASFAGSTNLNGIATKIQTALAAAVANSTCVWNATYSRFEIQSGLTGALSTLSFANAPTATGFLNLTGVPADGDKFTLNGTDVVFANPGPTPGRVTVGGTAALTAAALQAFCAASVDVQVAKFVYFNNAGDAKTYVKAAAPGVGGNALTLAKTGANLAVSAATLTGGGATDISDMLEMTSDATSGAYVAQGIDLETPVAAVTAFDIQFGQTWYAVTFADDDFLDSNALLVADYIEASKNKHVFGVSTEEGGVLSSVSTTDIAYLMKQGKYKKSVGQYSSSNPYSVCSLLARILTVNYRGNATVIDLMYKQEPGIVAENLTETQAQAIQDKNWNVFAAYNNDTAIIQYGKVPSGAFLDEITGTDNLAVTLMVALYNLLYTSPTKIPQTDPGVHLLVNVCNQVCGQFVQNGLLAPGTWNSNGFGTLKSGDYVPAGFYVYAPPVSSQLQADREARKSPVIQVAAKLAGSVQTVDVIINVNR